MKHSCAWKHSDAMDAGTSYPLILKQTRQKLRCAPPVREAKILLYIPRLNGEACPSFMHDTDLAYWGLWVVPLGLAICFGYAIVIWLCEELRVDDKENKRQP